MPATLQATIAARIDRLDPKAKRTLNAAAVIGSRFNFDLLTALGFEPVVADLVAAELIDQVRFTRHPEYVFHHPLIRTVAYESQLKSDRAELHRRLAAAIESREPDRRRERCLDRRASWRPRAICMLPSTGTCAPATWSTNRDVGAARVSWERARQVADALPEDDPDRMAMRIAPRTLLCATDWRATADIRWRFEELRELCAAAGDKISLAIGMVGRWHGTRSAARSARRKSSPTESLALLEAIGDPSLTARPAFGAIAIMRAGEMDTALRWAQPAIDWPMAIPREAT